MADPMTRCSPVTEAMVEAGAKAAAEAAEFCWDNCAQDQWRRDMRAGLEAALRVSDAACYVERSMVRMIMLARNDELGLKAVDELRIYTAEDFRAVAATPQALELAGVIADQTYPQMYDILLSKPERKMIIAALRAGGAAQTAKPTEASVEELSGLIEHGLCYGISSKDARIAARIAFQKLGGVAKAATPPRPDSIYSQFHLDNWTDDDFAKHTAATRKTLEWLLKLEASLAGGGAAQPVATTALASSNAVERVAKAIFDTWAKNRSVSEPWDEVCQLGHSIAEEARNEARAAIAALRDPSIGQHIAAMEFAMAHMKAYGVTALSPFEDYPPLRETTAGMYRAMIDAAMSQSHSDTP
jgi:hypothetical protein